MTSKKRGYFFILDAALALFIIIIGAVLIATSYANAPKPVQVGLLSDDLLNFLSKKYIKDLNNPYAGLGGEVWNEGLITDPDNTLLQQLGEFYVTNRLDIAEKFVQNVSKEIMPSQFEYEVWLNGVIIYPKVQTTEHNQSKNSSQILLSSKEITFGIINKTTSKLWGPYKAEVFVWER